MFFGPSNIIDPAEYIEPGCIYANLVSWFEYTYCNMQIQERWAEFQNSNHLHHWLERAVET
jgi:hypothetical protein